MIINNIALYDVHRLQIINLSIHTLQNYSYFMKLIIIYNLFPAYYLFSYKIIIDFL